METKKQVVTSCILPFYNEGQRVLGVLDSLRRVKNVDEIICVDDGSADEVFLKIKDLYPEIKLVRLEKNLGKSGAVAKGLKRCLGQNIILFDADLNKINAPDIEKAIDAFVQHPNIDMLLLRRLHDHPAFRLVRTDVVITGERILKRADLARVLRSHPVRFQLELAINDYMENNNKNVYWVPVSTQSTFKSQKYGFWVGIEHEYQMMKNLFAYKNPYFLIYDLLIFGRKRFKDADGR